MKIGMIGLGKLGLPCLLAMEKYGKHEIYGFDISEDVLHAIRNKHVTYWEKDVNNLLQSSKIRLLPSVLEMVSACDIIFVAVQTPHEPEFEGKSPLPKIRKDFDYSFLESAAEMISESLIKTEQNPLISVISTVLPGTMRERILPILRRSGKEIRFIYNPYFIAMGTTIDDFLNPEFVLLGGDSKNDLAEIKEFYAFLGCDFMEMDIESAELTKVAYNTFIGFKIIFANAISEIVEVRGGDVDAVTKALSRASKRLMSEQYMTAGMGDGGGCHPRDQIAMSWLSKNSSMSFDIFEFIASARDAQTLRQAELIRKQCLQTGWSPALLGLSYKPNSPLDIGSPARLLENYLLEMDLKPLLFDPWIYPNELNFPEKTVYFLSSRHDEYKDLSAITNSIIIDPWRFVKKTHVSTSLITLGKNLRRFEL